MSKGNQRGGSGRPSQGKGRASTGGKGRPSQGKGRAASSGGRGQSQGGRGGPQSGARVRGGTGGRRSGQRGTTPVRKPGVRKRNLGGDQVEGRHAVRELLLAGTRRTREVIFAGDLDEAPILDEIIDLADEDKVPIREISRSKFEAMARTDAPQGVLAMAVPLIEHELESLVDLPGSSVPFLLVLDGVTDPGNLGALLRVAEGAGVTGVILPRHRAARISPSVTKSAAGAIEHLPMTQVTGIPSAIQRLQDMHVWTVGLDVVSETSIFDLRVATDPVALVLGSEGSGLSRLTRERCDVVATIPLGGKLASLNVATAGAIACFEVVRRRLEQASS